MTFRELRLYEVTSCLFNYVYSFNRTLRIANECVAVKPSVIIVRRADSQFSLPGVEFKFLREEEISASGYGTV